MFSNRVLFEVAKFGSSVAAPFPCRFATLWFSIASVSLLARSTSGKSLSLLGKSSPNDISSTVLSASSVSSRIVKQGPWFLSSFYTTIDFPEIRLRFDLLAGIADLVILAWFTSSEGCVAPSLQPVHQKILPSLKRTTEKDASGYRLVSWSADLLVKIMEAPEVRKVYFKRPTVRPKHLRDYTNPSRKCQKVKDGDKADPDKPVYPKAMKALGNLLGTLTPAGFKCWSRLELGLRMG